MEMEARKTPRFWIALQPSIIRLYKVAGLVALGAILIGLLGFLAVNIFYYFDHTWVRPVVLTANHQKVIEAETQLDDAKLRASALETEKIKIKADLDEIKRTIDADNKFLTDVGTAAASPKTAEEWLVRREVEKTKLDMDNQAGRKAPLEQRQTSLDLSIKDQEQLVTRLAQSPYLKAVSGTVYLAFVPYSNLSNVKEGTKLYACSWGLVMCHTVGHITKILPGEVQDIHPHDESIQRGQMMEISLTTPSAANDSVLFAGSKPLWLF